MDSAWAEKQWGRAELGDARLTKRAIKMGGACVQQPEKSLPQKFQDWASVKGAYRFLASPKVTHESLQAPHYQNVIEEASRTEDRVLFIQDGSELLFNSHPCTTGLGPTADAQGSGLLFHSCLAVRMQPHGQSEVLGLARQLPWIRQTDTHDLKESESTVWLSMLKEMGEPPPNTSWVTVGDRGSDIYEFLYGAGELGWDVVVRAKHNRRLEVNGEPKRLHQWVRQLTTEASRPLSLRARGDEFSKEISLEVSYGQAEITPPQSSTIDKCKSFYFVRASSPGEPKLEWILITTLPVTTAEAACEVVEVYRRRWIIEEYHKCLKTGCRIEDSQLKRGGRLLSLLGLLGVVATQLLVLRQLSRLDPDSPADQAVSKDLLAIISTRFKLQGATIRDFWVHVARLGGFIGRKSDGDPGWRTIWAGWNRLIDMAYGYMMARTYG